MSATGHYCGNENCRRPLRSRTSACCSGAGVVSVRDGETSVTLPSTSGISRNEWLAAVAAVAEPTDTHPEAITMVDFCELLNLKPSAAKERMRALVKAQKARRVLKMVDRAGRRLVVPAYVLIKEIPDDRRASDRVERRAGRDRHAAPRRS